MNTTDTLKAIAKATDAALLPLEEKLFHAEAQLAMTEESIRKTARYAPTPSSLQRIANLEARAGDLNAQIIDLQGRISPLSTIYGIGKWSRFILVAGHDGHLHSSRYCSTLRPTTLAGILPDFSGEDAAGVVELAGEMACTVCFPEAPVDRPSQLPMHVEARRVAKEERETRAAAKAAKGPAIVVGDGRMGNTYKTLRAAENEVGSLFDSAISSTVTETMQDEEHKIERMAQAKRYASAADAILDAIKVSYPEYDIAALRAKKVATKHKEIAKWGTPAPVDSF